MPERKLPSIIAKVGFDFSWDERKVWALNVPVEEIPISDLTWHFEIPFWFTRGGFYDLTPAEVFRNPEKYPEEYGRIQKCDLSHPIDIMENKGRWLILDGLHRLAKAHLLGMKTVRVRKIPREMIPKIRK